MSDLSKLLAEISPEQRELLLLRLGKKKAQTEDLSPSQSIDGEANHYPLSYGQMRLWFLDQLDPGNPVYNVYFAFRLQGSLNFEALERSFGKILDRHEILRATFTTANDQPSQIISPDIKFSLPLVDLSHLSPVEKEAEAQQRILTETRRPFDLAGGPLFRVTLLKLSPEEHVLQVTVHHIVSDGWSLEVLLGELSSWYKSFTVGGDPPESLTMSYLDYVQWQKQKVEGEILREQLPYWRQQLRGARSVLDLPVKGARPARQTFNGTNHEFLLSATLTQALKALGQREGATLYMTLLAAFQTLLHRYTHQDDILIGSPVAGRSRVETEALMGMFVNTVVLRTDLSGNPTFRTLLARVREVALGAMAHQDLPFEKVVEDLQPERSLSHMPLFNVAFVFQRGTMQRLELPGLTATRLRIEGGTAKFDLTLYLTESSNGLEGVLEYNTDLFEKAKIQRMVGHFQTLLEGIVAGPDRSVNTLPLLTTTEEQQLVVEWNNTRRDYPHQSTIQELFEAQAQVTPEAVAVVCGDNKLDYEELNRKANQLAHYLRRQGVGKESLVGVCMDRSVQMVVALLGILKAGGACVPLDPGYPEDRLRFMLEDTALKVLVTQQQLLERLPQCQATVISIDRVSDQLDGENDRNPEPVARGENLAYVIYTSGSTGRPKGVEIEHRGLMNLISWHQRYYEVTPADRTTQLASTSFDASMWELWAYLTAGASVYIVDEYTRVTPSKLLVWMSEHKITLSFLPTPLGEAVLKETFPEELSLRALYTGGDRLHRGEFKNLPFKLVNHYGPTETTVIATYWPVSEHERRDPPIGWPLDNAEIYILDSQLRPVPIGIVGEIYIGGAGVARGYLKRPELTAERFVKNPFSDVPGARLYKTGDLARYLENGAIEFIGRIDQQVKLRGFRVELGEIESVISDYPGVREVALKVCGENEDRRLVAYVVTDGQREEFNVQQLREYVKRQLPEYMLPAAFVMLDQLPLSPNGKVDLLALPVPDQLSPLMETAFAPARTPVEEMLSGIWAEILRVERVGVHDNFFELGGHSLLATRVISRVRKAFRIELPLRVVFETPTVAEMAEQIEKSHLDGGNIPPLAAREPDEEIPLSFAQQRLWFMDQLEPGSPLFNVPIAIQLTGKLSVEALQETLTTIVKRHEILRTNYVSVAGDPHQVVKQDETPQLTYVDLRSCPEEYREQELNSRLLQDALLPFSLSDDLMLRATLYQLGETEHVLLLTTHHIAADGWSMGILFQEIAEFYGAFAAGKPAPPLLPIQYGDYAIWQRRWLRGEALDKELSYWRTQLRDAPAVLELPTDRPRPLSGSYRGAHHSVSLSEILTVDVKKLGREEGVTLFMVLLAAYQILLARCAGTEDVVVGTDVANRTRVETEGLIGFFVNLLVLRTDLSGNPTFRELLQRVREMALGAYAHQQMPFEKLVEELQPQRSLNRNPLVQVLFVLQNAPIGRLELPGLTVTSRDIKTGTSKFDLALFIREVDRQLVGTWVYNTDLFDVKSIISMARQYETLLGNLLAQPDAHLNTIEMVTETEKALRDSEKQERQMARRKNLLSAKRKSVNLSETRGIKTGSLTPNETLPLVMQPELQDIDLLDWASSNREFVERELLKHGAILFRNFNLVSAAEFEQFAQALCPNLFGEYGDLPREGVEGKIYGSTPYPADETILFHNESSHMHRWPMKIWFFCVKAAEKGGETPIVDCRQVYNAMDPRLRDRFTEKKLMYVRNYTEGLDVSWQTFFHTTDRSIVEDYCRKAEIDFEWNNGSLRTRQICPAVVKHPETGEMVFFNQLQLHHVSCLQPDVRNSLLSMVKEEDLPRNVYYGDGSAIEDSVVQEIRELYWKLSVGFQWQAGDVLMLNNMLTAHARNPFVGPRKIVVAMGEMMTKDELSTKGCMQ